MQIQKAAVIVACISVALVIGFLQYASDPGTKAESSVLTTTTANGDTVFTPAHDEAEAPKKKSKAKEVRLASSTNRIGTGSMLMRTMMIGGTRSRQFFHPLHLKGRDSNPVQLTQEYIDTTFTDEYEIKVRDEDKITNVAMLDHLYSVAYVHPGVPCPSTLDAINSIVIPILESRTLDILKKTRENIFAKSPSLSENDADETVTQLLSYMNNVDDHTNDEGHSDMLLIKAPPIKTSGSCAASSKGFPYGITGVTPGGLFITGLYDQVYNKTLKKTIRKKSKHVMFYKELGSSGAVYGLQRTVGFANGMSKLISSCNAKPVSPHYVLDPFCPWMYDVFKKYYLTMLALSHLDKPVTDEELRCPHIVIISRPTQVNGRGIRNEDDVTDAIRDFVKAGGPNYGINHKKMFACGRVSVVELETIVSIRRQIKLILNATVLIGTRGMGLMFTAFLRNRAGFLSLSGLDKSPASKAPWYPMRAAKPSVPSVLGTCDVVLPLKSAAGTPFASKCTKHGANFCDVVCRPVQVVKDLTALAMMMFGAVRRNVDHSVYADEELDNYLVIPH